MLQQQARAVRLSRARSGRGSWACSAPRWGATDLGAPAGRGAGRGGGGPARLAGAVAHRRGRARGLGGRARRCWWGPGGAAARCWPPFSSPAALGRPARAAAVGASMPRASAATPGRSAPTAVRPRLGALLGLHVPALGLWLVTGSLAAAAADTWATSLGGSSRGAATAPAARRSRCAAGTSGGMTLLGSLAALAGAALVAATGAVAARRARDPPSAGDGVGFAGMVADSALGACGGRAGSTARPATSRANGRCTGAAPGRPGREGWHG